MRPVCPGRSAALDTTPANPQPSSSPPQSPDRRLSPAPEHDLPYSRSPLAAARPSYATPAGNSIALWYMHAADAQTAPLPSPPPLPGLYTSPTPDPQSPPPRPDH